MEERRCSAYLCTGYHQNNKRKMQPEKRYQVFVSSTYEDLREERQEIMQALLELGCIPSGMELFPAADEDKWTLIKRMIDDCDYFIVVVGGRYGSISPSTGKSYTQMEYEYAIERGKPVIGFLHGEPSNIPFGKSEQTPDGRQKLEAFRELVGKKSVKFWTGAKELGSVISRSMIQLIKNAPAVGWVRADAVPDLKTTQELVRALKKIELLEAKIRGLEARPPDGIEKLAKGNDHITVNFKFRYYSPSSRQYGSSGKGNTYGPFEETATFTWNQIIAKLGPVMIGPLTEKNMKSQIEQLILSQERGRLKENRRASNFYINVNDDDFQKIKIQLHALGIIENSRSFPTQWKFTSYGSEHMKKLVTVKS